MQAYGKATINWIYSFPSRLFVWFSMHYYFNFNCWRQLWFPSRILRWHTRDHQTQWLAWSIFYSMATFSKHDVCIIAKQLICSEHVVPQTWVNFLGQEGVYFPSSFILTIDVDFSQSREPCGSMSHSQIKNYFFFLPHICGMVDFILLGNIFWILQTDRRQVLKWSVLLKIWVQRKWTSFQT